MTRKKILWICVGSSIFTTISGAVVAYSISLKNKIDVKETNDDDNKQNNFERYRISNLIKGEHLQAFILNYVNNNTYYSRIDTNDFAFNIKNIVRDILREEKRFKDKSDIYKIYINYKFVNEIKVNVETIWSLSMNNWKYDKTSVFYYDQFQIFLY
ncbi:MAG: hypothetical protein LBS95_01500 [Mycoplasmataceae bacterium]|jgi:flagellar basal body-associated protein FliL|nr:hypothetical protein [Mycoplasmataceae bacterium]